MKANEIYESVTKQLVEMIESGVADPKGWVKPWRAAWMGQRNAETGNAYTGFNQLILAMASMERGYEAPVWATYKQWAGLGAQVRGGSRGVGLIRMVTIKGKEDDELSSEPAKTNGESPITRRKMFPKAFTVFNATQVDGFTFEPPIELNHNRHSTGENVIKAMKKDGVAFVEMDVDAAYYIPAKDKIVTPKLGSFFTADGYYATKFHEIAHATGHERRLKREKGGRFGSEGYAREELIAELGSAFMCAATGIEDSPTVHHANYLASWAQVLRDNPNELAKASSQAQKTSEYVLELTRGLEQAQANALSLN